MCIRLVGSAVALIMIGTLACSQDPDPQSAGPEPVATSPPPVASPSVNESVPQQSSDPDQNVDRQELTLVPVPKILRLHLPMLGPGHGVLAKSVPPNSAAARMGMRAGDVVLEAGGRLVQQGESLIKADSTLPIVVIRRGRTLVLQPGATLPGTFSRPGFPGFPQPRLPITTPRMNRLLMERGLAASPGGVSASSSSISSGSSGRAVSVSRAGDQIAIEIAAPELGLEPFRYSGTAAEIEIELRSSQLPESVKDEIRRSLRQIR